VGAWLVARPPRDVRAAVWRLAVGLTALFLLAPATRAGYFMYPLGLAAWLLLTRPDNPGAASRAAGGAGWPASREPVPAGQPAS
jgi:phosphatidylinositol alpha-1,6-mannosyltransferase